MGTDAVCRLLRRAILRKVDGWQVQVTPSPMGPRWYDVVAYRRPFRLSCSLRPPRGWVGGAAVAEAAQLIASTLLRVPRG